MPNAISVSQCWALLHQGWFGHLSVSVNALPLVVPVEYCVTGDELALCLGQYALPASALDAVVGFATETLDPATREGWSIQIQGRSHTTGRSSASTCARHERGQIAYLTPQTINGQHLHLCPIGTGPTTPTAR
jgi:hypothetical protein